MYFTRVVPPLQDSMLHSNPQQSMVIYLNDDTDDVFPVEF
jgi:hypothetical protein